MPRKDEPLCAACEGCPVCTANPDCCIDCTGCAEEGLFVCECEGHYCGPAPADTEPEEPLEDSSEYVPGDYDLLEGSDG